LWYAPSNPKQCRDIMTKDPVCCAASETANSLAKAMREHDIGAVPIVSDQGSKKLVGVVTDRDLALRVVAEDRDPKSVRAEEVMSRDVATCSPESDIQQCMETMERRQVRRVPIVDNSGRMVGMIAQADIAFRMRRPEQTAEVVQEISRPGPMRAAG
jgi:CBS domain-containing protein